MHEICLLTPVLGAKRGFWEKRLNEFDNDAILTDKESASTTHLPSLDTYVYMTSLWTVRAPCGPKPGGKTLI